MMIEIANNSDFSIHNIPFGVFSTNGSPKRIGTAIGDQVIDLAVLSDMGILDVDPAVFRSPYLNDFIALGKLTTSKVRADVQSWLKTGDFNQAIAAEGVFYPMGEVDMYMPLKVGDYTDFYSSIEHATNVGKMFRDPENALLPNWRHLPVGYHGRASSIVVSGAPIKRPWGQVMPKGSDAPVYQLSKRLDFELEMAFVIGKDNELGEPISIDRAADHIFGMVLFNDWSARDIQKWEYVPLGPFLGKNFASSISPWVVTMEALMPFRVAGPTQEPAVLPYLERQMDFNFDIDLEVCIQPKGGNEHVVSRSNFKYMYWDMLQQLVHHTVNGCNARVGDLMASGTISGKSKDSYGSMLELSWGGTNPVEIGNGQTRTFIEDYDTVSIRGYAEQGEVRVGFGEVSTQILPNDYE